MLLYLVLNLSLHMQVDVELARTIANVPLKNKDLQKKLWLKIAEHVIKKENNIEKQVISLSANSRRKLSLCWFQSYAVSQGMYAAQD